MAGEDPDGAFDADEYRAGIRAARLMGLPQDEALRPTFLFPGTLVHDTADPGNRPWDFNVPAIEEESTPAPDPVQVVCGVQVEDGGRGFTSAGKFEARRATLAFFEDEWAAINEPNRFDRVLIGGNLFKRGADLEPRGLFTVTTYKVEVLAEDLGQRAS